MYLTELRSRAEPIRVGVVGIGRIGRGVVDQVSPYRYAAVAAVGIRLQLGMWSIRNYSGLPVRRLRSAPANGASSAEKCPNPWPPRRPSDRPQLPPGPPCTSAQSRSSPSCAG